MTLSNDVLIDSGYRNVSRYGDLTHDDTKESAKEKLQSKTTEKED